MPRKAAFRDFAGTYCIVHAGRNRARSALHIDSLPTLSACSTGFAHLPTLALHSGAEKAYAAASDETPGSEFPETTTAEHSRFMQ